MRRLIRVLFAWVVGWFRRPWLVVSNFKVEVDEMKNARFTWDYPTERQQGGPLDPADIVGAEIELRVAGAPDFTVLGQATFPTAEFVQANLDNGSYEARCTVITDGNVRGAAAILAFDIVDDSPAVAADNFAVELT